MRTDNDTTVHEQAACRAVGIPLSEWIRCRNALGVMRNKDEIAVRDAVALWLMENWEGASYPVLAEMFGTPNHGTVIHMVRRARAAGGHCGALAPTTVKPEYLHHALRGVQKANAGDTLTRTETAALLGLTYQRVGQIEDILLIRLAAELRGFSRDVA